MAPTPGIDPKKAKQDLALNKTALQKALAKDKDGNPRRIFFAFAPGKAGPEHLLRLDHRRKGQALMQEIAKAHKDRKQMCYGTATVVKEGGQTLLMISYVKKLPGAERKMQDALKLMRLPHKVKLETEDEVSDKDIPIGDDDEDQDQDQDQDQDAAQEAQGDDADDDAQASDDNDGDNASQQAAGDDDAGDQEDESEDDQDGDAAEAPAAASKSAPMSAAKLAQLGEAPKIWHQTRTVASNNIEKLRAAIKKEYSSEAPDVISEIDKGMKQLDRITQRLDHRLAEQLDKAHKAADEGARKAEIAKAKAILVEHIKYISSEPLLADIDSNPFGVETNLKKLYTASLTHMAKVIS